MAVPIAGQKQRRAPGAWEKITNKQQRKLVGIYDRWSVRVRKAISNASKWGLGIAEQHTILEDALIVLRDDIAKGMASGIASAAKVSAGSRAGIPEVLGVTARHITEAEKMVGEAFIPTIHKKLLPDILRGVGADKKALRDAFLTVRNAPAQYAGSSWVTIFDVQRALGKVRALELISEGKDPEPVRWVLDDNAEHCLDGAGTHGCISLEGEYDNWDSLPTVPAGDTTCRGNCRCHLEVYREGEWQRGVYAD